MKKKYVYVKKRYIFLFTLLDAAGYFISGIFKAIFSITGDLPGRGKNIAVIELAHMGDVLAITPAIRLLKKKFPASRIICVVSPWNKDIISGNPDIDEIIVYRASWFDRIGKKPFSLKETAVFIGQLRQKKIDLGIDMRGDVRVIFLMWVAGIKYRVGYAFTGGGFLLNKAVPFEVDKRQDRHQIDHNIRLINAINFTIQEDGISRKMAVFFSDIDKSNIERYLETNSIGQEDFLIAIHPGTGLAVKCWPVEKFKMLIEQILQRYKVKIVLVGGPSEVNYACELDCEGVVNAIGHTGIKQLMALLKRSNLFVGGDSGLMHIASAVGTPIAAIWSGQSRPSLWAPLSGENIIIDKPLADISVKDAMDAVSKQISKISRLKSQA